MEKITIRGLVATTPRYIITQDGLKILSFRLASYDSDAPEGQTNWYTVSSFNDLAYNGSLSIEKGHRVFLTGSLRIRDWDNGERTGTSVEIEADALGHDLAYGTSKFERTQYNTPNTTSEAPQQNATQEVAEGTDKMNNTLAFQNVISIEGQDNNVADFITQITNGDGLESLGNQKFVSVQMFGSESDNPRWLGAELVVLGDRLTNGALDEFRVRFPNINAEVK